MYTVSAMSTKKRNDDIVISVRLLRADISRLEAMVKRMPFAKRAAVAREALLLGLTILEKDPSAAKVRG